MNNTTKFETGATSHAVNDLILFTDNTKSLAAIRDRLYQSFAKCGMVILGRDFRKLCSIAKDQYIKEFPDKKSHKHIKLISNDQVNEYCRLYADDFENWKSEHGYK